MNECSNGDLEKLFLKINYFPPLPQMVDTEVKGLLASSVLWLILLRIELVNHA